MQCGVDNIATTLIERHVKGEELFEPRADGCTLNIRDLIIAGFGTADKFRLGLGFQTDRLWENAGQTAVRLYPATSLENREKAFTLLEVLAPKSAIVRSAIVQWAKDGDPLSVQKMRRLGELIGAGVRLTHPRQSEILETERLLAKIGLD